MSFQFALFLVPVLSISLYAAEDSTIDVVEKKAKELGSSLGSDNPGASMNRLAELSKLLERTDKFDLVSLIWKRAESDKERGLILSALLYYLIDNQNSKNWLEHPLLEAQITSHINDESSSIRTRIFILFHQTYGNTERMKPILLAALGDKDDIIRGRAVKDIDEFDKGTVILSYYVSIHKLDPAYAHSVKKAKALLNVIRE